MSAQIKGKKLKIEGGNRLVGETKVDGAKNAALILVPAACLATEGVSYLENIPSISDIDVLIEIMREIGVTSYREGASLSIEGNGLRNGHISETLMSKMRQSILFLGPLVSTLGEATIYLPGGDNFGVRPIDIHLSALESFGVEVNVNDGIVYARAKQLPLKGTKITLRLPSFGATVQSLLTACRATGETIIENVAMDPEIMDLIQFLNSMGAKIKVTDDRKLIIQGGNRLQGIQYQIIPDRLEAGALLTAFAMTKGSGIIHGVIPGHNHAIISLLRDVGLAISFIRNNSILVDASEKLSSFRVTAGPYPGLSTDLQPLVVSLATICNGESIIEDPVFNSRFSIRSELIKMGAQIDIDSSKNLMRINGVNRLKGSFVEAKDIRAAVGLVCAGLSSLGTTYVSGLEHLHRGHGNLVDKLFELGAKIKYVSSEQA
ncbi:UDP-N-acetylglucosamine 1-carboxyvinyltransferase [Lederbergia sp. NSJ-179]|uniref:UDP-N-acetylglucosamine 1-carboxyvinyltransferase n=1 Tax=Lederbergia sp. NSJ-179 TaxID=2931402 RepID=UPI001FD1B7A4|nr:UDP-N-acetylglucosamine 1-carboxyvinyltransferase [Lederbergia sp. NSJ-179]MCJ7841489.1 UDP-N-acetylglucosamine 1-carboxyvinyltransferase [Lederbergia sp. NSJ-179]